MKVKLTIELELPDGVKEWEDWRVRECISDGYVDYVRLRHIIDETTWFLKAKIDTPEEDSTSELKKAKELYTLHKNWSNIAENAEWDFEIVG